MKQKWIVVVEQNGGEYTGWVTFYAEKVIPTGLCTLDVDGTEMEFDEAIESVEIVVNNPINQVR